MLLGVQSPIGTKRIECNEEESTESVIKKIQKVFGFEDLFGFKVFKDKSHKIQIPLLERKCVKDFGLKHGDIVYLMVSPTETPIPDQPLPQSANNSDNNHIIENLKNSIVSNNKKTNEDEVDVVLYGQNGLIERSADANLCQHGPNAKCVYCAPIEPYNESYLREHNIKHMSFHTYLKKLTNGIDKGKFAILENLSCKIRGGCGGHAPWPAAICTKCQPSAITLNRQVYRHIDNVNFENPSIVDNFLNYWRKTGHQRIGFLFGYYSVHKDVPLGIKATVVAIYEPPQESARDFIRLSSPDKRSADVEFIASELGLKMIGWVFTDLIVDDIQKGTVKYLRNVNSHFLSAQECIMAGFLQNIHPNICRYSPDTYFGSKFVTVCITGDVSNQVHMEGYQVSNQCMALVRDNCLLPTKDAPELGYVRGSSSEQYVPDVFYKEKDGYGNEVMRMAQPLPIEYLLVDVPVSTPMDPKYSFNPIKQFKPFPIENRCIEGHIQDFNALSTYMRQFNPNQFLESVSDFHLLIYLMNMDVMPLRGVMQPLLEAIRTSNTTLANQWSQTEQWRTVRQLIDVPFSQTPTPSSSQLPNSSQSSASAPAVDVPKWSCNYCTFENDANRNTCEMCSLPKGS